MNKTVVVLGTQWGDEGKGKISNYLSQEADYVVRYQGGDNAGHTICFDNNTYKLHLLPSGVFNPKVTNILGNGMVVNVRGFLKEVENLKSLGFTTDNLFISSRAQVLFDYHLILDGIKEKSLGEAKIGTTNKGIGPAYTDKASRSGIRFADFIGPDFPNLFLGQIKEKNLQLSLYNEPLLDPKLLLEEYLLIASKIKPYVIDSITLLNDALGQGKKILFEGAQGTLLDIDFGTYPYVTSSNCSAGGVATGSGIGPNKIKEIIGVVKAYSTRVGSGAFVTEFEDDIARQIRRVGNEYGTTTKRPRRIGWFDGVIGNYSRMVNGLTGLAVTLLDVLSGLKTVKLCTHYKLNGEIINTVPASISDFGKCEPIYEELPGWEEDITQVKSFEELPKNAQNYLLRIEEITKVPVIIFSVGPDQMQTVIRRNVF